MGVNFWVAQEGWCYLPPLGSVDRIGIAASETGSKCLLSTAARGFYAPHSSSAPAPHPKGWGPSARVSGTPPAGYASLGPGGRARSITALSFARANNIKALSFPVLALALESEGGPPGRLTLTEDQSGER